MLQKIYSSIPTVKIAAEKFRLSIRAQVSVLLGTVTSGTASMYGLTARATKPATAKTTL